MGEVPEHSVGGLGVSALEDRGVGADGEEAIVVAKDLVHCIELNRPLQLGEVEHAAEVGFQDVAAAKNDLGGGVGVDPWS